MKRKMMMMKMKKMKKKKTINKRSKIFDERYF